MTDILLIAVNHVVTAVREKVTLFWFLIFPVFLLVILSLIFGQIGQEGQISFEISLANEDAGSGSPFPAMIEFVFDEVATTADPGKEPLFRLRRPASGEEIHDFVASELIAVRRGRRAALVVLPEGLGREIEAQLASGGTHVGETALEIHYSEGNASSAMAVSIIDQILAGIDREILARAGAYDASRAVPQRTTTVGSATEETPYVNFLLPGIVLMGFFTTGLFGIPGAILFSRDQGVLRRYWVTPLDVPRFLGGLALGHISLCVLQFAVVFLVGRLALGATVSFAGVATVLYLLLAVITFMAFGFLIASVAKTANSGMAIANILNMPMMFLSGLFFPITGLPFFLRAIVYVNPVSYLADGLRAAVGVDVAAFPRLAAVLVPIGWILASTAIAAWRLRWDVSR